MRCVCRIRFFCAVFAAAVAVGATAADGLWFCADFDNPTELDGTLFNQDMREGAIVEGRFGKGYRFVSGNKRAENDFWRIDDPERMKDFPFEEGSFVCWFRMDDLPGQTGAFFSFCGFWQYQWVFSPLRCCTTAARGGGCQIDAKRKLGTAWHHCAVTWSGAELAYYLDGRRIAQKSTPERVDMRKINRAVMRFGAGGDGRAAFGGTMDEIAIFRRALAADEVKRLAASDEPIRAGNINLPEWNAFPNASPPPDKDSFVVHSWGGYLHESMDFRKTVGINCVNVRVENVATARQCVEAGLWVNLRIENSKDWNKFAPAEIARRVKTLVDPYRNLENWNMSLVNSEVYHASTLMSAVSNGQWCAQATRELGHIPETSLVFAPPSIDCAKVCGAPFKGVQPENCASLNTLNWYLREGNPFYDVNKITADAIRMVRPDVTVWSEPTPPAAGLDMIADWIYDYGTDYCLLRLRQFDAKARGEGVRFMPTISGSYHHSWMPKGWHPYAAGKDGNPLPVTLAPSCDETMIKAWMVLGAAKADAISVFNAAAWETGATNALALAGDPKTPVKCVAEPDFADRFGRFMRERFLPVAKRFKGCPSVRSKLALVCVDDCLRTGAEKWRPVHYRDFVGTCLARGPVAFDVLTENEMRPEILSRYRYVILPMFGNGIAKNHYDALCAVSHTTKVVTDGYCTAEFPNVEKLDVKMPYWWSCHKEPLEKNLAPLTEWLDAHTEELRKEQFAWSDRDGKDAFTFVKEMPDGGKAVLVVNDKRENRSLWPQFCTNANYRAIAAPNSVTLHMNLPDVEKVEKIDLDPAGVQVFVFDSKGRRL